MAERLKYLATDSRSLQELIQGGYLYVDKTEHLYQMIRKGSPSKYWFLARPRRFGKSLTVDTFLNIFSGCKELFKDTYIYDKHDFSSFPVIRLNMNNTDNYGLEEFLYTLKNNVILPVADELGVIGNFPFDAVTPSTWLNYLLDSVSKKYGKQVVVLIDEYDYPLLDSIPNKTFEEISKRIESFYSALKAREERIKFCFITGITRFSQVSIFSKLNNLIDISNDPDYTALCGYTDDEINRYFSSFFRQYFEKENIDSEEEKRKFRSEIKEYYDGYRFSLDSDISVYNPVSIGRFFTNGCRFENYWIETGAQSLVDKIITGHPELFREGTVFSVEEAATRTFKIDEIFSQNPVKDSIYSYLIQAGYLTMKCNDYGNIILDYPNREVRDTMNAKVISTYGLTVGGARIQHLKKAFMEGDTKGIIKMFQEAYMNIPYDMFLEKERNYQIAFFTVLMLLGFDRVEAEERTNIGRIDITVTVKKGLVYIIELKLDENADTALNQIKEKKYYEKYLEEGNIIHLLGINFSSIERNITDWKEEVIS